MTRVSADLHIPPAGNNVKRLLDELELVVETLDLARNLYFSDARQVSEHARALLKEFGR